MNFRKTILAVGMVVCVSTALAEDKKMVEKPAIPTLGQIMDASGIKFSGYVDTSYTYLSGTGAFTSGVANRVFDTERRSFNLNMLDLTISNLPEKGFGGMVELNAGSDAKLLNNATAGPTANGVPSDNEFAIQQGYFHYANGPLMFIAGKFVTLAGAEVIKSPDNLNFSRSILFGYAIPFTHTGVRGYFTPNDKMKFIVGMNNGWDVVSESQQTPAADGSKAISKTLELGVSATPIKELSLAAAFYRGKESCGTGAAGCIPTSGERNLLDLVATYSVNDALSFTLNYDKAEQDKALTGNGKAKWNGLAAYVNYKLSDAWRVAFRTESFDDKDGFRTGVIQKWKENTLTLANTPAKNVELRGEVRHDSSNKSSFLQPDAGNKKGQSSLGLEAIYKF